MDKIKDLDLDLTLQCFDAPLPWYCDGQDTGDHKERTCQHPWRLLMASLEIQEDLFYEYFAIEGRGDTLNQSEASISLIQSEASIQVTWSVSTNKRSGLWAPPSSSPWTINNKGSESDVRIGHKHVTPRSRGVTHVTKTASVCRRSKFFPRLNLWLCMKGSQLVLDLPFTPCYADMMGSRNFGRVWETWESLGITLWYKSAGSEDDDVLVSGCRAG